MRGGGVRKSPPRLKTALTRDGANTESIDRLSRVWGWWTECRLKDSGSYSPLLVLQYRQRILAWVHYPCRPCQVRDPVLCLEPRHVVLLNRDTSRPQICYLGAKVRNLPTSLRLCICSPSGAPGHIEMRSTTTTKDDGLLAFVDDLQSELVVIEAPRFGKVIDKSTGWIGLLPSTSPLHRLRVATHLTGSLPTSVSKGLVEPGGTGASGKSPAALWRPLSLGFAKKGRKGLTHSQGGRAPPRQKSADVGEGEAASCVSG